MASSILNMIAKKDRPTGGKKIRGKNVQEIPMAKQNEEPVVQTAEKKSERDQKILKWRKAYEKEILKVEETEEYKELEMNKKTVSKQVLLKQNTCFGIPMFRMKAKS